MDEVWMLDYLNAVFPGMGVFKSEEDAMAWASKYDPKRAADGYYTAFKLTVNDALVEWAPHTAPFDRYRNQR